MGTQIYVVMTLTFIISLIGTLAYAVRIVGIRTGKIAISFALFNILVLVSRTANSIQAPLLAKVVETNIQMNVQSSLLYMFRMVLVSTTLASIVGAFLIPTFQRIFHKAVQSFSIHRSVFKLLLHGFSKAGVRQFKASVKLPTRKNLMELRNLRRLPQKVLLLNIVVTAILTVGVLSSLYAGTLKPEFRTTCSTLTSVINGFATILAFIFVDPQISIMTDDVIEGKYSDWEFQRFILFIVAGRVVGTVLAQFIFVPSAQIIAYIAGII